MLWFKFYFSWGRKEQIAMNEFSWNDNVLANGIYPQIDTDPRWIITTGQKKNIYTGVGISIE